MKRISLSFLALLALVAGLSPSVANAQVCPFGYYYASDGRCYPGPPPPYPPPVYVYTPPVVAPPPIFDGFLMGAGLGALFGSWGDGYRGYAPRGYPMRGHPGNGRGHPGGHGPRGGEGGRR